MGVRVALSGLCRDYRGCRFPVNRFLPEAGCEARARPVNFVVNFAVSVAIMESMPFKIALVNMPFGYHIYPSIQLGTLSTQLKSHGWDVKSHYLNLHFASRIGFGVYNELCEKRHLIGEWLFSDSLFGEGERNQSYMEHFAGHVESVCHSIGQPPEFLRDLKQQGVPEFLAWAVEAIDWGRYAVVGFTSTFNQNLASVTLAKLIKEKYPSVITMFGGANFDSEMGLEYVRVFPWVDCAVTSRARTQSAAARLIPSASPGMATCRTGFPERRCSRRSRASSPAGCGRS